LEALKLGAFRLQETHPDFPPTVSFRYGNGLNTLYDGEVSLVCVAGIGVPTMLDILDPSELERVNAKHLILQPTNSRPRYLMDLYDGLSERGWFVQQEKIASVSSRWYMTTSFAQTTSDSAPPPVSRILPAGSIPGNDDSMKQDYQDYIQHHIQWLQDILESGIITPKERQWMEAMLSKSTS